MKLSVLLVSLLVLSWTNAEKEFRLNPMFDEKDVKIRVARSSVDGTNLHWVEFNSSVPDGTVSIQNTYVSPARTEYVCKCNCQAGYYSPSEKVPACVNPFNGKERRCKKDFYFLVNRDNFELLEWKDGYHGSMPKNPVSTCDTHYYVGRCWYGLGKIDTRNKCIYYPWDGVEKYTNTYQALNVNKDVVEQTMTNVKYKTEGAHVIVGKPEVMRKSITNNNHCKEITKTVTLTKEMQTEQRWDVTNSVTFGVSTSVTAGIPDVSSATVEISLETTMEFSKGASKIETHSHSVSISVPVPPKESCTVTMIAQVNKADIPFTATLSRTYANGKKTKTTCKGVYRKMQVAQIQADVQQCEIIGDMKDCPDAVKANSNNPATVLKTVKKGMKVVVS